MSYKNPEGKSHFTATRPAEFTWTPRPGTCTTDACRNRVYRITEPDSVSVIDTAGGQNPGRNRRRVGATVDEEYPRWVVWTKGYSDHGNSSTRRTFDTLEDAERHIMRWARRRWRVALDNDPTLTIGDCKITATREGWTMSGPSGTVAMDAEQFDAKRALAHWRGFCQVNGVRSADAAQLPTA